MHAKRSKEELIALKDSFVENFISGVYDGKEMKEIDDFLSAEFHRSWEDGSAISPKEEDLDCMAEKIMDEDFKSPVVMVNKDEMPNCLGARTSVMATGGTISFTALSQAFCNLESYNVMVSAIVAPSVIISYLRTYDNNVWTQSSPEEAEERGVFGRIWTAEVYARNHLCYNNSKLWLLACPNGLYRNGLCTWIDIQPESSEESLF